MPLTAAVILAKIAPSIPTADVPFWLEAAGDELGEITGRYAQSMLAYYAAHLATLAGRAGNTGAVEQVTEGDLSLKYASQSGVKLGIIESTSYGQQFLALKKASGEAIGFIPVGWC